MMDSLRTHASAGWVLAQRNIGIQIRDHALGYGWTFLVPALYAVGFVYLKREFMADATASDGNPRWELVAAFCGVMLVQFWLALVQDMADVVGRNRALMRGLSMGPAPFIFAVALEGLVSLGIRMVLILVVLLLLGHALPAQPASWLAMAAGLVALQITAYGLGLFLAPWSALYPDIRKALQSLALPLILVTPIFYAQVTDPQRVLYWVHLMNPLSAPFASVNAGLQSLPASVPLLSLASWSLLGLAVMVWSALQLRWQVPVLLERIGD